MSSRRFMGAYFVYLWASVGMDMHGNKWNSMDICMTMISRFIHRYQFVSMGYALAVRGTALPSSRSLRSSTSSSPVSACLTSSSTSLSSRLQSLASAASSLASSSYKVASHSLLCLCFLAHCCDHAGNCNWKRCKTA